MNRYFSSFLVTALLYGGVFVAFIWTKGQKIPYSDQTKELQTIEVSLMSLPKPTQEEPKPIEEVKEEIPKEELKPIEEIKEELPEEEPKAIEKIEKEIPKEIQKEKVVVKKDTPKPKKRVPKKPIKQTKPKPSTPKSKPTPAQKSTITHVSKTSAKEVAQKKNLYFTTLKNKIERCKSYPIMAKRRGIKGNVRVQFTLTSNGALKTITILSGSKIFHSSIKSAISAALPYSPPQGVMIGNQPITLTVEYSLE
jgi:protein TonB